MIKGFPKAMEKLMIEFSKMPGIGMRSAQRLTSYILQSSSQEVRSLLHSIYRVKKTIKFCKKCNNLSEQDFCDICSDKCKDQNKICVVEESTGVFAIEKIGVYNGLYHVLLGQLSPINGIGPDDLKIEQLINRVKKENIEEIIIATDFTTEGETTALYIFEVLKNINIKITRLARGIPMGAMLEYADVATLERAFQDRQKV